MESALLKKTLPEELVVEILLNLPVSSLLRCRCVCKSWFNLIKDPNFINLHLIKNQNHDYIIVVRRLIDLKTTLSFLDYKSIDVIAPDLEIPLPIHERYLSVCGPCNGLICISDKLTKIILCNPSMRQIKEIPLPQFTCPEGYNCNDSSIASFGLGFDSSMNDYKIVTFIRLEPQPNHPNYNHVPNYYRVGPEKIQCLIYNVGINTWRKIDHQRELDMSYIQPYSSGVLLNGTFHFIAMGIDILSHARSMFILCFDMSTEVFGKMTLPDYDPEEEEIHPRRIMFQCLPALNDSLALFAYDSLETWEQKFVEIWVMKEYGVAESWTKQITVGPMINITSYPLLVRNNETILVERILEDDAVQLISRGFDTEEVDAYEIYGYRYSLRVLVNQESLVSIN